MRYINVLAVRSSNLANSRREIRLEFALAFLFLLEAAHGDLRDQPAQLKPDPHPEEEPPEERKPPDVAATPQAPGTDISLCTFSEPQFGQGGGGASERKMIFSYRSAQFSHWYS